MKLQCYVATLCILVLSYTQAYNQSSCNSLPTCTSTISVPVVNVTINGGEVVCLDFNSNTALDITFTGNGTLLVASGASVVVDDITSSSASKIINLGNVETTAALELPNDLIFDNCGIVNAPFGLEIDAKFNNDANAEIRVENQVIIGANGIITSNINMCITNLNGSLKTINGEQVFTFCYFKTLGDIEILTDLVVDGNFFVDGNVLTQNNLIIKSCGNNSSNPSILAFTGEWTLQAAVELEPFVEICAGEIKIEAPNGDLKVVAGTEAKVLVNVPEPSEPICSPVLPIELSLFKVYKNKTSVVLQWQTLSELNNSHFEIERSKGAKTWKTIGEAKGAGTSLEQLNYEFTDIAPFTQNYYRLKQVDFDGQFTYSAIVYTDFEKFNANQITLFPNPVSRILNVKFQDNTTRSLQIFNSSNQIVGVFNSAHPINVEYLPNGIYTIIGRYQNTLWSEQFLKN